MDVIDFVGSARVASNLEVRWIHGARRRTRCVDPAIQIHRHDAHTFILRQSMAVNYEAPFMHLSFGNDRALVLDNRCERRCHAVPWRRNRRQADEQLAQGNPPTGYQLVVAHSHAHSDHVAGDGQFARRLDTVLVGSADP